MKDKQEQVRQAIREAARDRRTFGPIPDQDITRDAETHGTMILAGLDDLPSVNGATATVTAYRLIDMIVGHPPEGRVRLWARAYTWVCRHDVPTEVAETFHQIASGTLVRDNQWDTPSIVSCVARLAERLSSHREQDGPRRRADCTTL